MNKPKEILELEYNLGFEISEDRFTYERGLLTKLDLSNTIISDISFLSPLNRLRELKLKSTKVKDINCLKVLKNLISLDLSDTKIQDISALSGLIKLEVLNLESTNIKDLTSLAGLKDIVKLILRKTHIVDISPLNQLKKLEYIDLSFTLVNDVSGISELEKIKNLWLNDTLISSINYLWKSVGLMILDLSNTKIKDISSLSFFRELRNLDLSITGISNIESLSNNQNLSILKLSINNIESINSLKSLDKLTILHLDRTKIRHISSLKSLEKLEILYLNSTNVYDIRPLSSLLNLRLLHLGNTHIGDISDLKNLTKLNRLFLGATKIHNINVLSSLKNLTNLDLNSTYISDISSLNNLENLAVLDLRSTFVTDLSSIKKILLSKKIRNISLYKCPIVVPSKKILEQGLGAIKTYFEDIEKHGSFKLFEAKLLIVGEPGAGKTSLRKKLIDEDFEIGKHVENETIGVHIHNGWKSEIAGVTFTTNIWDFGGQERQYPLHQYFLDDKSVYVLLSDDRTDNPHLDKWFTMIRLIGGEKAKIILILNQKERTSRSINFNSKKYTDKGFDFTLYDLDLSKDQDKFLAIRSHIQETLYNLDHIGQSLPKNICEPVREAFNLLKITEDYIPYEQFEKICIDKKILDPKDQAKALDYLSTVGDVVHYKNDPTLKNLIILNPLWLLDAIYAVITCDEIDEHHTQGKFDFNWLATFLAQSTETRTKVYKESESTHILNLMLKNNLDICYKYNDKDYLIPLCMPENILEEPIFTDAYNLTWLFKYEIMPSGIVAKTIVRLSDYILDNKVSKNAVLLKKDNTTALLQEYYVDGDANKYIRIFASGTKYECLEFLNEIKGVLKSIHKAWYKFIAYEEYIPCICSMCNNKKEAELHSIDEISKRINNNKKAINCKKLGDDVALANLIGHVSSKKTEKIRELRYMLEDMQKYIHLNGEFNILFSEALMEIQGNIFDVEDKVTKKTNSKLQVLFEKGKNFKDWVTILGIPADVVTKGEKMYQMLDDFLKNG